MKHQINFALIRRTIILSGLLIITFSAVRAQTTPPRLVPTVCIESSPAVSGTTTLSHDINAGQNNPAIVFSTTDAIPVYAAYTINPGGANEQSGYVLAHQGALVNSNYGAGIGTPIFQNHSAGETVQFSYAGGKTIFGYQNNTSSTISITAGLLNRNFLSPGPPTTFEQTTTFLPGIHQHSFELGIPPPRYNITYNLDGLSVPFNANTPRCAVITYQGKLSNAGAAASGNYDLRFTLYDVAIGGAAQSDLVTVPNVAVINGVFTAPINFGSTLFNNNAARFLEIAVRPASANQSDPYTTLSPRQPVTDVPYAVNAQKAFSVSGGFVQLPVLITLIPLSTDCNAATQYGQTQVDATNNKLYICTASGWKFTALQ